MQADERGRVVTALPNDLKAAGGLTQGAIAARIGTRRAAIDAGGSEGEIASQAP
jgi:hypothetical protein